MYESRLFRKQWYGSNRSFYGLENRYAQQPLGVSQRDETERRNRRELAFEIASTDGMNEKGLVANLLWLPETEYPVRDKNKPGLAITAWVQYMLDNFATVEEAVAYIDEDTFQVVSDMMPDGSRLATLHLSISDATGDCAILIYRWETHGIS